MTHYTSRVLHQLNLISLVIVAELGDFNPEEHKDRYLSEFRFLPSQSPEFENEVSLLHKQHRYV